MDEILSLFSCSLNNIAIDKCISRIQKNMKSAYLTNWHQLIGDRDSDVGKLYLYRKLKSEFRMEPYLKQIKQFKLKKAMTIFRISAHKLEIETGRYMKTKCKDNYIAREDRICTLCHENNIRVMGDEEHAIMVCASFNDKRDKLLAHLGEKYPMFKSLNNYNKMFLC